MELTLTSSDLSQIQKTGKYIPHFDGTLVLSLWSSQTLTYCPVIQLDVSLTDEAKPQELSTIMCLPAVTALHQNKDMNSHLLPDQENLTYFIDVLFNETQN